MAKIACVCGEVIALSGRIPNPLEWRVVSDESLDQLPANTTLPEIDVIMRSLFRCRNCDRLWIFWDGFDAPPSLYEPALGTGESLVRSSGDEVHDADR